VTHLTLLLIGDIERPEFRGAAAAMHAACRVVRASSIASAADRFEGDEQPPDLVVLTQARPGEYAHRDLLRLRHRVPLAPFVVLLGTWSEGEMRTGEPLPDVVRVYWHQWMPRFEQQIAMFARGVCPSWGLPSTSTDEERLLWTNKHSRPRYDGVVAIVAERHEPADWLTDACAALGLRAVRTIPGASDNPRDFRLVLWDALPGAGDVTDLAALREAFDEIPIVVVTSFPRTDDRQRLLAAGAAAVLSKPMLLEDLEYQLESFCAPNHGRLTIA
jgi:CheY-like chemotaxis protein